MSTPLPPPSLSSSHASAICLMKPATQPHPLPNLTAWIDWLVDWLVDWLTCSLNGRLTEYKIDWMIDIIIRWWINWLSHCCWPRWPVQFQVGWSQTTSKSWKHHTNKQKTILIRRHNILNAFARRRFTKSRRAVRFSRRTWGRTRSRWLWPVESSTCR